MVKSKKKAKASKRAGAQRSREASLPKGEKVLVLRTCAADMTARGGFLWPDAGMVRAPDWDPAPVCGQGLHGLLWGEGSGGLLSWAVDAKWLVVEVLASEVVALDGGEKVKFPRGRVVFTGGQRGATDYLRRRAPAGKVIVGATVTVDEGSRGTATAGYGGTATAGDGGTATAGYGGTATAGYGGSIAIERWDSKAGRWRKRTAEVGPDAGQLKPDTPYRLDEAGAFVEVPKPAKAGS